MPDNATDLSDTNPTDTPVFVDVKPKGGDPDGTFAAQKRDAAGNPVGPIRHISANEEFTFILAKGKKVVGCDEDLSDDSDAATASVTTHS
jgi:hypothetical protein